MMSPAPAQLNYNLNNTWTWGFPCDDPTVHTTIFKLGTSWVYAPNISRYAGCPCIDYNAPAGTITSGHIVANGNYVRCAGLYGPEKPAGAGTTTAPAPATLTYDLDGTWTWGTRAGDPTYIAVFRLSASWVYAPNLSPYAGCACINYGARAGTTTPGYIVANGNYVRCADI
jgi:hypothetical protein